MTALQGWGRASGPILHTRTCAAVTAASCVLHVWFVIANQHGPWLNILMLAMVALCLPCALHIWRYSRANALRQVMASALAMALVHTLLLVGSRSSAHGHHGTAAGAIHSRTEVSLAVIALEMATALLASTLLARLRMRTSGRSAEPA
ncbi:hypothetical protein QFZ65_000587 [Arthrobacter sp. B3I9]|uniref:hypothetical protein n=1 Tax=Arthrobacter sp. B3I9 TaxID=3042270 RepID=UPI00278E87D2|nr:hypothetical protein [Arthrobacter sp. B3I9]MDQ0848649.1 hypothetical protein [Arthrobacter sp. B3I9]